MDGGPKENANPTVLRVEKTARRRQPLGWTAVQSLSSSSTTTTSSTTSSNSTDRAIRQALQDADQHGKGLSMLRSVGVDLNHDGCTKSQTNQYAYFPAELGRRNNIKTNIKRTKKNINVTTGTADPQRRDAIDADEIFEIIRNIQDPEHPLTLEQLGVVSRNQIKVEDRPNAISKLDVRFTPTIPHCSMATQIGLCILVKLLRSTNGLFKVTVRIEPGTHNSENSVNKQLADKERVCAALENKHLLGVVNKCIKQGMMASSSQYHVHSDACSD